jgi:hypothetical protein
VKIKKEPVDSDEFPCGDAYVDDEKPTVAQFGKLMELFTASMNDLMIFQFPDSLPGKATTEDEENPEVIHLLKLL